MVKILANLYIRYDNLGLDKLLFYKKDMILPYCQDFEKVIYI